MNNVPTACLAILSMNLRCKLIGREVLRRANLVVDEPERFWSPGPAHTVLYALCR